MSLRLFIAVGISFLIAGCAGTSSLSQVKGQGTFERQVAPFEVSDADGQVLDQPFLGGFNAPRPQFADINADGRADLFIQENSNDLMFFENQPAGLSWQTDRFHNLDIGEWYRFADFDQDGDMDLLAEQPYSYIRYYRNEGSAESPRFTLAADTLRGANGEPIFSDRQNIPNVTDIDCDDRLDLFVGRLDGTVTRYESRGLNDEAIPQFELVSKKFEGISIVKQIGTMHGANTLTFEDIDNDGDQDLFWGDFFEPSLLLVENRGTCNNPELQGEPQPFPSENPVQSSGYNAPAFADLGQDGDRDLLVGVLGGAYNASGTLAENLYFYEQNENSRFQLRTKQFLNTIDLGNESIPAAGDIDGDGDTDLLVANKIDPSGKKSSVVYRYENRGTKENPELHQIEALDLPNAYHYAPELGDLNGDGRLDLLLGTWKGRIAYYQNKGDDFEQKDESFVDLDRGSNSVPALADLDADGDLDLLVGESGGGIHFYENKGSAQAPDFVYQKDRFEGVEVGHRSVPSFRDIDGDGDLDLFMGSKMEGIVFYRNNGTSKQAQFQKEALPINIKGPRLTAPEFVDFNGDGAADFLSGGQGGGLIFYRWTDQ